jgi:hypothetical protein
MCEQRVVGTVARAGLLCALLVGGAHGAGAQTVEEYARRVDSLARLWRSTVASPAQAPGGGRADSVRLRNLPPDSVRVGPIRVRTDSAHIALAREVAERLAPIVTKAYGRVAERLARYVFVMQTNEGATAASSVLSAVTDSTGSLRMRSSDLPDAGALTLSWSRKAEETITDEVPGLREWIGGLVPVAPPTNATWSDARMELILSGSTAAHECASGAIVRCEQVLGLLTSSDPAFTFYDAAQRRSLIEGNARNLRRADTKLYDRCIAGGVQAACDSLVRQIPAEAVPNPTNPAVRQSLARFAIAEGGDGAFERFAAGNSPRAKIEGAARLPMDAVIARWNAALAASRNGSPALDPGTALSALAWATLCACLALRSSRWR